MSHRAQTLARRFELANERFVAVVNGLSPEQWRHVCADDGRSVAALAHHVAEMYAMEAAAFAAIAAGRPLPPIERDAHDRANLARAERDVGCSQQDVATLATGNAAAAAAIVGGLTDEELSLSGVFAAWMPALAADEWIERVLIGHVERHLATIEAAVALA